MGWTNPKTWGVAETVDDVTMNLHVRDNLLYLKNAIDTMDHGALLGLGDDDHLQYMRADGVRADHGVLSGLGDDDHGLYIRADGARAFTGDISHGNRRVTSLGALQFTFLSGIAATDYQMWRDSGGHVRLQIPDTKVFALQNAGYPIWSVWRQAGTTYAYLYSNIGVNVESVRLQKTDGGSAYLITDKVGSGSHRNLHVGTQGGAANLYFRTVGTDRWRVDTAGLIPQTNQAYNLGASGARVRNIYAGDTTIPQNESPGCSLYRSAAQSIPNVTWTNIVWTGEWWDSDNFHSPSSTRITIPANLAGKYMIHARVMMATGAVAARYILRVMKNGGDWGWAELPSSASSSNLTLQWNGPVLLNATVGMYFEVAIYQNSGIARLTSTSIHTHFSMTRIGDWD